MTDAVRKMQSEIALLTPAERAELALLLTSSFDEEDLQTEAEWDAELDRRLADFDSGRVSGVPAEQVMARLRAKYP